jgi:cytochrome c5
MKSLFLTTLVLAVSPFAVAAPKSAPLMPSSKIDGELVYKTNCTRCHSTPPSLSERQSKAVAMHMRVRANLLADQANAVLQYLAESAKK